jgi:hypothetical protein
MNSGALLAAKSTRAGCGRPFVGALARLWPTPWEIAARRAPSFCAKPSPRITAAAPLGSDFWEPYAIAFPARTHRCCGKSEGETNHVERWFGALRARLSRLVRRAYSFSKSEERHADAIHLFIACYNLGIQQQATMS